MTTMERGRCAFWDGQPIWVNPYVQDQAAEWRQAWHMAKVEFHAAGGRRVTSAELQRLRPRDLPATTTYHRLTRAGAARRSAELRQQGIGWRWKAC